MHSKVLLLVTTIKLKLGYRAGRLIDQLEAAGIVGL
jgi:hypothetical protein